MVFDIGKWLGKILFESHNFQVLYEYSTDEKHLYEYILCKETLGFEGTEKVSNLPNSRKDSIVNCLSSSVSEAIETMCNNMNVIAVAFMEGMMKDLAVSVFVQYPARMYQYVGDNDVGSVSLKLIIKEETKDTLLLNLANVAASNLLKGKFSSNIKNLEDITKSALPENLKISLVKIVSYRNEFVHESKMKTLTNIDVKESFDVLDDFLKWMGKAALEQGIPVNDPVNLVGP